jgi:segregation and condensation protein B
VLRSLAADYDEAGRGFELRSVAGGWRLYTRADCAPYVERFVRDGQPAKLSQAALETLAVVAYRQPTTRSRIAAVRGVNVDAVIRTLLTRGLIAEVGIERETGAIRYATTEHFLERLGLDTVEELPPLAEFLPDHTAFDDDAALG